MDGVWREGAAGENKLDVDSSTGLLDIGIKVDSFAVLCMSVLEEGTSTKVSRSLLSTCPIS